MPPGSYLSSAFLNNFKTCAALYHAKHPDNSEISEKGAKTMLVHRRIDKNELATLKDPFIKCNFDKIYRNIMVNDDATWTALSYLQECKNTLPGFDYQIHYGLDGLPDCIVYITSEMRSNLLRYGDIFFLDAQKRAFNAMGWPYIGIALFNNEMMVCICCEAICQIETIEMYTWIILTLMLLEPRWNT